MSNISVPITMRTVPGPAPELSKRTRIPVEVLSNCPRCSEEVTIDYTRDYLSYPVPGEPFTIYFCHECEDGEECEWESEQVVLRVTIEPVVAKG